MKAIRSTRQVTKAMELVAASKMRRAVTSAQQLRAYAGVAAVILERIADVHPEAHPYLRERPVRRILAILLTSDRGLCGPLNAQLFRETLRYVQGMKALSSFQGLRFLAIGRKGQQFLHRTNQEIVAAFPALSNHPTFRDVLPICRLASESFLSGDCNHVVLIYTNFRSALKQDPRIRVLLPFSQGELKEMLMSLGQSIHQERETSHQQRAAREYLLEPSQDAIVETILPQLTEAQIYQAVLEAAASEHSARMVAMHNATDNATDLLEDLTLTYNQTRQATITSELIDLSTAKAALEGA